MREKIKIGNQRFEIVYTQKMISTIVSRLARMIRRDYKDDPAPLVLLIVLNGAMYFGVDLSRRLEELGIHPVDETIRISKYSGDEKTKKLELVAEPIIDLTGCNVIVVEDVKEEGETLRFIDQYLKGKNPKSVDYCVLLSKAGYPPLGFDIKYCGEDNLPPAWLVGYGLDSERMHRPKKFICAKI